jgi:ataxin-3
MYIQFTAPDLSAIAQNLDTLEDSYRDEEAEENRNMDDTGARVFSEPAWS